MPDFETRAGQVDMAVAVARQFETGGVLLAEAGTGTGKTLAYLIPAILSRQRVLVSTGTKNLQEQIYFKDIPALRDTLGVPFTATCMKGRANYLCLHRLDQLGGGGERTPFFSNSEDPASSVFLPIIREWAAGTETGDRAELEDLPEDLPFWSEVSATAETCLGTECPRYDDCFVTRMRQRAAAADIVIVNHHLLCADAAVRQSAFGEVIPACANAIVDEAHQLEDVATQYFGFGVSNYRVDDLSRDVERLLGTVADVAKALDRLRERARHFFAELADAHRGEGRGKSEERVRASESTLLATADAAAHLTGALDLLESTLALSDASAEPSDAALEDAEGAADRREAIAALARRTGELRDELRRLLRASDAEYVYFVELRGRGVFLRAAPVDVSAIVREVLLDRMRTVVLTSATLTVDDGFSYIRQRLGISRAVEICLPS
jgi:ATP-dependent DNA helicase DinG